LIIFPSFYHLSEKRASYMHVNEVGERAIHIYCSRCRGSYKLDAKACLKCETAFKKKKYRVCVSVKGKRVTRFFDNLTLAREAESAIKADILRGDLDIKQKSEPIPTLNEVWTKYLPWAKEHKKTWDERPAQLPKTPGTQVWQEALGCHFKP